MVLLLFHKIWTGEVRKLRLEAINHQLQRNLARWVRLCRELWHLGDRLSALDPALGSGAGRNSVARRLGRSCSETRLEPFVQSLVVYFVASGVIDAFSVKPDGAGAPIGA